MLRPFFDENQTRLFMKIKKGAYKFHPQYWAAISDQAKVCCVCLQSQTLIVSLLY
jgi:hypothetical protein